MATDSEKTILSPPSINDDFENDMGTEDVIISDGQYAELTESTNAEQLAKLQCWDIKEYLDNIAAQQEQLNRTHEQGVAKLEEAKAALIESRTKLRTKFDTIFGPLGLANQVISIAQTSPHIVTVHHAADSQTEVAPE